MKWLPTVALVIIIVLWGTRECSRPEPVNFPTTTLDSIRTVTETLRVQVRVRDTLWRTEVRTVLQGISEVIASVDSLACKPVINKLKDCAAALEEAQGVADDWKTVALRDSAQVVAERARADTILQKLEARMASRFTLYAGPEYASDSGLSAVLGLRRPVAGFEAYGDYRLPLSGAASWRVGARKTFRLPL